MGSHCSRRLKSRHHSLDYRWINGSTSGFDVTSSSTDAKSRRAWRDDNNNDVDALEKLQSLPLRALFPEVYVMRQYNDHRSHNFINQSVHGNNGRWSKGSYGHFHRGHLSQKLWVRQSKYMGLVISTTDSIGGDWKCGSGKCDTVKIARVENAGVEKAGVDNRGGKCRSGKCRSI